MPSGIGNDGAVEIAVAAVPYESRPAITYQRVKIGSVGSVPNTTTVDVAAALRYIPNIAVVAAAFTAVDIAKGLINVIHRRAVQPTIGGGAVPVVATKTTAVGRADSP